MTSQGEGTTEHVQNLKQKAQLLQRSKLRETLKLTKEETESLHGPVTDRVIVRRVLRVPLAQGVLLVRASHIPEMN